MTAVSALLARHSPRLRYDSQEVYFADSAAIWTDSATNVLKHANGTEIARPPTLKLDYLGAHTYQGTTTAVLADDVIGETTKDYAKHAAALHAKPAYKDKLHARAKRDSLGRLWLQYWFFYYYNDFQLAGPFLSGGNHEGDWEMIQIRLDATRRRSRPCTPSTSTPSARLERRDQGGHNTPSCSSPAARTRATSAPAAVDGHVVGQRRREGARDLAAADRARLPAARPGLWPGFWGDTKATSSPIDSRSWRGPGPPRAVGRPRVARAEGQRHEGPARRGPAARPATGAQDHRPRQHGKLVIGYDAPGTAPTALVVGVRPSGSQEPATSYPVAIDKATGEVEIRTPSRVPSMSRHGAAQRGGVASPAATTRVG